MYCMNMVDISRKTYEINGVEKIADKDGIFWLNEKQMEDQIIKISMKLKQNIIQIIEYIDMSQ